MQMMSPGPQPAQSDRALFDYDQWGSRLSELNEYFINARPYQHVVLENLLARNKVVTAAADFPRPESGEWIHYFHVNERKLGRNKLELMPARLQAIILELNSPRFVAFLRQLTGIPELVADPSLEGGGLHQTMRGGYLNIHADFSVHPHKKTWRRQVNLILYLNEGWRDEYGGHLELWDGKMRGCEHRIAPILNRAVIFNTTGEALHGHPEPLTCPREITRKSIALYYFTEEEAPPIRSTDYRARPGDGVKRLWIYADKMALRFYDRVKRRLNLSDRATSDVLQLLSRAAKWPRQRRR